MPVGRGGVLWGRAESATGGMVVLLRGFFLVTCFCCRMTAADRNDLMPPQVKELEWVTPKISLMVAEDTEGGKPFAAGELARVGFWPGNRLFGRGPS